jgi:hypothetical protein
VCGIFLVNFQSNESGIRPPELEFVTNAGLVAKTMWTNSCIVLCCTILPAGVSVNVEGIISGDVKTWTKTGSQLYMRVVVQLRRIQALIRE